MSSPAADLLAAFRAYLETRDDPILRDFVTNIDWSMKERAIEPATFPALRHLSRAVEIALPGCRPLLEILAGKCSALRWGQTYTAADLGQRFIDNYGWTELFGTRGHFLNETMAAGFLILGPNITYPDHHHTAEELYLPLTGGTEWRKGEGAFVVRAAGEVIHHPSNVSHAMRTGVEPLVALYLWRGGPLAQKSTITRTAGRT